jgi:ABC-type hemin transport system substrate-binding protein
MFADVLSQDVPLTLLQKPTYELQIGKTINQTAQISSTAQKAQSAAGSTSRQVAKATMGQKVGQSSAGRQFMSTMVSSASGRKVLDLAKSAKTIVSAFK